MTSAPLLLLDVDGVLNALSDHGEHRAAWPDWSRGSATSDGTSWPILWAPAVVDRLLAWHEEGQVELQWLTTWGHDANGELRALLGLPHLTVAGTYEDEGAEGWASQGMGVSHASVAPAAPDPLSGEWWKYDVVRRLLDQTDRRLIWVDDELHRPTGPFRQWADAHDRVVAVGPAPRTGLTAADLEACLVAGR